MKEKDLELLAGKLSDKTWRMQNLYKIKTKDNRIIDLKFNFAQKYYWANRTNYDIILKARQLGFSTLKLIDYLDDTIWNKHFTTAIIAHRRDSVQKLFRIIRRAYDSMPPELRPKAKYDNVNELYFAATDSNIYVATEIRGDMCNNLHVSEVAFIDNAEEKMTATFETVPKGGRISMETTANGVGGYFYNLYNEAVDKKNKYKPFFFPWFNDPEYAESVPANFELSPTEQEIKKKFSLTNQQMTWRRFKKQVMKDNFEQEYPATALEAFIHSGSPVFNFKDLQKHIPKMELETKFHHKIFVVRDLRHTYSIGVDVSEGVGLDESSIDVIDSATGEQVAHYSGQIAPDLLAYRVKNIANYYNQATVCVEVNNHGLTTLTKLQDLDYPNLYVRKVLDRNTQKFEKKDGWRTTRLTKPNLIDNLVTATRDLEIIIYNAKTLSQMQTFVYIDGKSKSGQPNHGMGAIKGELDDGVISIGLAVEGLTQTSKNTYQTEREIAQQEEVFDPHSVVPHV